jgi:hypothetical protein
MLRDFHHITPTRELSSLQVDLDCGPSGYTLYRRRIALTRDLCQAKQWHNRPIRVCAGPRISLTSDGRLDVEGGNHLLCIDGEVQHQAHTWQLQQSLPSEHPYSDDDGRAPQHPLTTFGVSISKPPIWRGGVGIA